MKTKAIILACFIASIVSAAPPYKVVVVNEGVGGVSLGGGATNIVASSSDSYDEATKTLSWNTNAASSGEGGVEIDPKVLASLDGYEADYYVAKWGSDTNSGDSWDNAFLTLSNTFVTIYTNEATILLGPGKFNGYIGTNLWYGTLRGVPGNLITGVLYAADVSSAYCHFKYYDLNFGEFIVDGDTTPTTIAFDTDFAQTYYNCSFKDISVTNNIRYFFSGAYIYACDFRRVNYIGAYNYDRNLFHGRVAEGCVIQSCIGWGSLAPDNDLDAVEYSISLGGEARYNPVGENCLFIGRYNLWSHTQPPAQKGMFFGGDAYIRGGLEVSQDIIQGATDRHYFGDDYIFVENGYFGWNKDGTNFYPTMTTNVPTY